MLGGAFTECQEKKWLYKHSIYYVKNSRVTVSEEKGVSQVYIILEIQQYTNAMF